MRHRRHHGTQFSLWTYITFFFPCETDVLRENSEFAKQTQIFGQNWKNIPIYQKQNDYYLRRPFQRTKKPNNSS